MTIHQYRRLVPGSCLHCGRSWEKLVTAKFCNVACKNAYNYLKNKHGDKDMIPRPEQF